MNMRQIITIITCSLILTVAGCSSYYKVTDPGSGKIYYTNEIEKDDGAIEFEDANSGSTVTIQNSEVTEISKEEFKANTPKD